MNKFFVFGVGVLVLFSAGFFLFDQRSISKPISTSEQTALPGESDYTFDIPPNWKLARVSNDYTRIEHENGKIEIVRLENTEGLSLDAFIEKQQTLSEAKVTVEDRKEIFVDGFPAVIMVEKYGTIFSARVVYIQRRNQVYSIVISAEMADSDMQRFLESFKFTESASSVYD